MNSWTRCWLAVLFVGCSPSVVCWIESFVDFDFFSAIFISWIIKDIQKAPHRRLEEVSEQCGSDPLDQLATHFLKTTTTGERLRVTRLTCNSGVNFRNRYDCWSQRPIQCIQLWSQILLVWIWISWKFIHHQMSESKQMGSVPKNSVSSQHSCQSNKYKTEQPFLSGD